MQIVLADSRQDNVPHVTAALRHITMYWSCYKLRQPEDAGDKSFERVCRTNIMTFILNTTLLDTNLE